MTDKLTFATLRERLEQPESLLVEELLIRYPLDAAAQSVVYQRALGIASNTRQKLQDKGGFDAFLATYDLSSREGVLLMCLAEAFLRIPDTETADALIRDTLGSANWNQHLGDGSSLFVNTTTWALLFTGRMLHWDESGENLLKRLVARSGEPIIRQAVKAAMRLMGSQFVLGQTMKDAITRSSNTATTRYSYDMLGEAARTNKDAQAYFDAYLYAIQSLGNSMQGKVPHNPAHAPSISIKLSALHPRYEHAKSSQMHQELLPRLLALALQAKQFGIGLTIDAEESARLELSLELFACLAKAAPLTGWNALGLVVQAYQKRALAVLDVVVELAQNTGRVFPLRLVKGAYWDSEIKLAQEQGLGYYPVFTRKPATDLHYLVCAQFMLANSCSIYPCFATHNAYSIASIEHIAKSMSVADYEFQRLHGMGEDLYNERSKNSDNHACRVYAPVGNHQRLLGYLMRRLLENGANSSFVNALADEKKNLNTLLIDPAAYIQGLTAVPHPKIPLPAQILHKRNNSRGLDLSHQPDIALIGRAYADLATIWAHSLPAMQGNSSNKPQQRTSPASHQQVIGSVVWATAAHTKAAIDDACAIWQEWDAVAIHTRAQLLRDIADLLEEELPNIIALIGLEGGRTQADALSEVREAIDFCRYYANQAENLFTPMPMEGVSGEDNLLYQHGRGVFVCISPWNFPVAIFTGQIVAALVSGNCVIAKPAEQTPLCAFRVISLIHQALERASLPQQVVQLVLGDSATGAALTSDSRIAGVAFTGSTATAKAIQKTLCNHPSIPVFIAETGGLNALIADSSALPEQLVHDVVISGFNSAGQRCSALRLLCVQDEMADTLIEMLAGALAALELGEPHKLASDIGPVIDQDALAMLKQHRDWLDSNARLIGTASLDPTLAQSGNYFAPCAYEIDSLDAIKHEVFGPIVHLLRWKFADLDRLIDGINAKNYGLTFGVHTRINSRAEYITRRIRAGNLYINRNIVGAVVGSQPFGGLGLSGTGPKAGGPHYLQRFATEVVISTDTTAAGGNATLLAMQDEFLDEKN